MTSERFEQMAKEKVAEVMGKTHGVTVKAEELQVVWFTHCLGNKKCLLWSPDMGSHYAEVTYSVEKEETYVDIYKKVSKSVFRKV